MRLGADLLAGLMGGGELPVIDRGLDLCGDNGRANDNANDDDATHKGWRYGVRDCVCARRRTKFGCTAARATHKGWRYGDARGGVQGVRGLLSFFGALR